MNLSEGDHLDLAMSPNHSISADRIAMRMKVWLRPALPPFPRLEIGRGHESRGPELSWPESAGAHVLQQAGSPEGPWRNVDARRITLENGEIIYRGTFRSDSRFYRLER